MTATQGSLPRLGVYVGRARDVTCPGDNVTYEVVLHDQRKSSVQSIPELSFFKGGQPPWQVEGTWELDDGEVIISVTKQDVTGPRRDSDMKLPVSGDGSLSYRGTLCVWKHPPPEADPFKSKQEEIARVAAETHARQAELDAKQEEFRLLQDQREATSRAEQEELKRLRDELQRQREQQEAEMARAEEERARLAAEAQAQQALFQQQQEEMSALMKAKEEVKRREEEMRQEEDQRKALAEQQALLEAQRLEEERVANLAEVEARQEELRRQQQEVERQRAEEEVLRKAQAETFKYMDQELRDRADNLQQTEQVLSQERELILKSRSSLAMVQAHVVSMLGKGETINLDACDEPEAELDVPEDVPNPSGDDIWNMDWSSVESRQAEAAPTEGTAGGLAN
eukprot:CAMPEP_0171104382 /NCGR_PEP_ID=MMETSP0766_2-20121228/60522_1 /TAXON_ID=439317 /ORGANISM="Gambierdiscus australes, Strain CAWD 149" /LENGTH=397 /DNA_ID=CAMNT_0011565001 /DNA_START=52 /DNA_END=1245 /DNA_ORIENTATION=+